MADVTAGDRRSGGPPPVAVLELPPVEAVDAVPQEALPALVAALAALQARAAARMAAPNPRHQREAATLDELLTISEAARRLRTTEDWLYRHAARLPFSVRVGRGQLRFSAQGISHWIATQQHTR